MKAFFAAYPEYRKDDVYEARDLYLRHVEHVLGRQYCMKSHKFIFDGAGAMKKSELLAWCEKVVAARKDKAENMKGLVTD